MKAFFRATVEKLDVQQQKVFQVRRPAAVSGHVLVLQLLLLGRQHPAHLLAGGAQLFHQDRRGRRDGVYAHGGHQLIDLHHLLLRGAELEGIVQVKRKARLVHVGCGAVDRDVKGFSAEVLCVDLYGVEFHRWSPFLRDSTAPVKPNPRASGRAGVCRIPVGCPAWPGPWRRPPARKSPGSPA